MLFQQARRHSVTGVRAVAAPGRPAERTVKVSSRTVDVDSEAGTVAAGSPMAAHDGGAPPRDGALPGSDDAPRTGSVPGNGEPPREGSPHERGVRLPGRRAITVWFAVFTLFAGGEIFTGHADGTWGAWACGGYAVATILLLVTRNWLAPLAAAVAGAFLAPLAWMILKVPATSTAEVVVINRSADYLAKHGTPYLPASLITDWLHYNPYLPLMELFGLPREAGLPGLLGDPRIWTSLVTLAAITAAFAVMIPGEGRRRDVAVLTAIAMSSPLVAFQLTVGVTDPPLIALSCLALALAARRRFLGAALVLAVACAMKPTVWPVVPVIAAMAWFRDSRWTAVRFTGAAVGATVALALAAAPNALATPDAIKQNLIDYPLGRSTYKTVAESPLPGHLIAQLGHAGPLIVDALLVLTAVGFLAWLVIRPPRDIRDAVIRLVVAYTAVFTLDASSRFGYYAYPLALVGWLALTRSKSAADSTERLVGPPHAPR